MRKFIPILLCLVLSTLTYAQQPEWQTQVGDLINKVEWIRQSDFGTLICGSNNGIYAIDNLTGKQIWENKEIPFGANTESSDFIAGTPFMVIEYNSLTGKGRTAVLDILKGKILYNSKDEGVKVAETHKMLDAGGLLLETIKSKKQILTFVDFASGTEKWSLEMGSEKGGIGLGAIMRKLGAKSYLSGAPFVSANGYIIVAYQEFLKAINPADGSIAWTAEMKKDIKNYTFSTDKKLIFTGAGERFDVFNAADGKSFLNKSIKLEGDFNNIMPYKENYIVMHSNGFNIWDVSKMSFQWEKEKNIGNISEITVCPNGFAGLENGEKGSKIYFMDFTGKKLWDESLDDPVLNMYATSKGVWYVTEKRSNVLSFEKGKDLWKRDVKLKGVPSMAFDEVNKHMIIYADKVLYRFDLNEVNMTVLTEDAGLKDFDEEKEKAALEVRRDGYLVSTPQNLCFVGRDGAIKFNKYFKEVGLSKAMRSGLKILGTAATLAGGVNATKDVLFGKGNFEADNGIIDLNDPYNYSQLSGKTRTLIEGSEGMFDMASKRYHATKAGKDAVFILTKFDDGTKGLAKVGKDDGSEQKRFLFKDKDPVYVVDEVTGKLYLIENEKTIMCFSSN